MHKHTQNRSERFSLGERRFAWLEAPRNDAEIERQAESIVRGLPDEQRELTKQRIVNLLQQQAMGRPEAQPTTEAGGEGGVAVPNAPEAARVDLENRAEQYRQTHGAAFIDRGPVAKNAARTSFVLGTGAFAPAYVANLAQAGGGIHALTGGAFGVAGALWARKHWPKRPLMATTGGAAGGLLAASAIKDGLVYGGGALAGGSAAAASVVSAAGIGALGWVTGGWLANAAARRLGKPQANKIVATTFKGGTALGGLTLGAMIPNWTTLGLGQAVTTGLTYVGSAAEGLGSVMGAAVPGLAAIPGAAPAAAVAGATVAGGGGLLYLLGRAHGKLWDRPNANMWKTMLAGATIGLPSIALGGLNKLGWKPAGKFAKYASNKAVKNYEAAKDMILNFKIPIVAPVAKGVWRTALAPFAGLGYGLTKASSPSENQQKLGNFGKVLRSPFYAAGRITRTPKDLWDYLWSPAPPGWPFTHKNQ